MERAGLGVKTASKDRGFLIIIPIGIIFYKKSGLDYLKPAEPNMRFFLREN